MSPETQTIKLLPAYFISELLGTFFLVLIGDGAIAAYVFTGRQVDLFTVCFAFGVAAMVATYTSSKLSGAQLNPAVTIAFALDNKVKWSLVPVYIAAQYLGGFLAALLLFLNYYEAIQSLDGGNHTAFGSNTSTASVFATYPAPYVTEWGALLDQVVGTAVLLFALAAVGDRLNMAPEERFQPPIVALIIGSACLAFTPNCGAIFNPARDLSPRLLTAILGYPSVWSPINGTYWILAGVVGPHIGAIIGHFSYKYLIGTALEANKRHLETLQQNPLDVNDGSCCSSVASHITPLKQQQFAKQTANKEHVHPNYDSIATLQPRHETNAPVNTKKVVTQLHSAEMETV